jgi:hypothetical protein
MTLLMTVGYGFRMPLGRILLAAVDRGKRVIVTTVVATAAVNCTQVDRGPLLHEVRARCGSASEGDLFFPRGVFSNRSADERYSKILRSINEPSLSCGHDAIEAYRLVWIHVFQASPTIVRIQRSDSGGTLVAYQLSGDEALELVKHTERQLTISEWQKLSGLIKESEFWSPLPPRAEKPAMLDPDTVFIEGRNAGSYNVLLPWSAVRDGALNRMTRQFLVLAGLPVPADLVDR